MKYYDEYPNNKKRKEQEWKKEHHAGGFKCSHCRQFVVINNIMGTANRNHCHHCLWSKHVDESKGDRLATCNGGMRPIGLTFKHEGYDRIGEIMLIHLCSMCRKISINRVARDDLNDDLLVIFYESCLLEDTTRKSLVENGIYLLSKADENELFTQLFGG